MRKPINSLKVTGRLYSHKLKEGESKNQNSKYYGIPYIMGTIQIAIDDLGLNVIDIRYGFTPKERINKEGQKKHNPLFDTLEKIMTENKTWEQAGAENATILNFSAGSLTVEDSYNIRNETYNAFITNNGGNFINYPTTLPKDEDNRDYFETDMLIVRAVRKEAEDNNESMTLSGYIFNYNGTVLYPVNFTIRNPQGMDYFEGEAPSEAEPLFTKVWGKINSRTVTTKNEGGSAWGEVHTTERKVKEWEVTGSASMPYEFGEENVLTREELQKMIQDRNVHLAEVKKNREDYEAANSVGNSTPQASAFGTPTNTTFNFGGF